MEPNPKLNKIIRERYSPRTFLDKPIKDEDVELLFEAARWAPSGFNEQPWNFLYAKKEDPEFSKFLELMVEFNQNWAKNSALLVLSVAKMNFEKNGDPNDYAFYDTGLAMENMVLQATDMGIHSHQMSGFDKDKTKELFNIPDGFEPVTITAFGYLGDKSDLSEDLKKIEDSPRERKPLDSIVRGSSW